MISENFKNDPVAKGFKCHRTKTTCIINEAIAPTLIDELVSHMSKEAFSIMIDGSNDTGILTMNPITVRIFDLNRNGVTTNFYNLCLTEGENASTAETLFQGIDQAFNKHINWLHCVAVGVDNTSVNIGARNSIMSRVTKYKNPKCFTMGCPCHIIHNCAKKASAAFTSLTGFDVDDACIDLYYHFANSTKRKDAF